MAIDGFDGHTEDFELAIGSVTGARGFKQDGLGRLTGVSRRRVFRPGANTAECDYCALNRMDSCGCGYYAYFKDSYDSFYGGTVGAIVQGYGKTIIGTQGFRAEKAELKAFFPLGTIPAETGGKSVDDKKLFRFLYPTMSWYLRHTDKLAFSIAMFLGMIAIAALMIFQVVAGVMGIYTDMIWITGPTFVVVPWLLGFINRGFDSGLANSSLTNTYANQLRRSCREGKTPSTNTSRTVPEKYAKLQTLYPDVPFYHTFQEAIAAHPLTTPEEHKLPDLTPDNTPEFWDLEVDENLADDISAQIKAAQKALLKDLRRGMQGRM